MVADPNDAAERFALLRRLPLFANLSEREVRTLATVLQTRRLEAGATLCEEGDRGHSCFIVAEGVILVRKELPGGTHENLKDVGPGNILGQVALIDQKPRSATLIAKTRAIVLECGADDFDRLFRAGTVFTFKLIEAIVMDLAGRLREADRQLFEVYSNPGRTLTKLHESLAGLERAIIEPETGMDGTSWWDRL